MKSLTMNSLLWRSQCDVVRPRSGQPTEKVSSVNCGARVPESVRDVVCVRIEAVSGLRVDILTPRMDS